MKKIQILLIALLSLFTSQYLSAQVLTKYGDNVGTLDGMMKAYYDVVTIKKGEKASYERDSLLHWPNVNVGMTSRGKDGKLAFRYMSLKEFHRLSDPYIEKNGFYEQEISRKIDHFGAIYHVFSTYESRAAAGSPVTDRGINSIELYFDGKRFWLLGWFYDSESKDNPIPKKYLQH